MRRLLIGASTILLVLAAASCGKSSPPADTGTPEVSAGPVTETVPGLPDYPGATRVAYERKGDRDGDWSTVTKAEFTSSASFADVVAHYETAIAANSWTVTEVEKRQAKAKWELTREDSVAEVRLKAQRGSVEIKVERKDR